MNEDPKRGVGAGMTLLSGSDRNDNVCFTKVLSKRRINSYSTVVVEWER